MNDSTPVQAGERIELLDVLRGFAVFGIFVANLMVFSGWYWRDASERAATALARWNAPAEFWVQSLLVEGKFYTIFSLLFGIGFAIQLRRAERRGTAFASHFRRRLAVLLGIGLVHLVLLWPGDILTLYAVMGFFVLAFRTRSDRVVLAWAAALVLLPIGMHAVMLATGGRFSWGAPFDAIGGAALRAATAGAPPGSGGSPAAVITNGTLLEVIGFNVIGAAFRWSDLMYSGRPAKVLAMFLVGFWVGRRGIHEQVGRHAPLLRRVCMAGFAAGLPLNYLLAVYHERAVGFPPSPEGLAQSLVYALGVAPLGLAYAAGVALLWDANRLRPLLGAFAPVGRMALTNYLAQTLVGIGLMYGIGLGWGVAVGPAVIVPIAVAVFMFQIGASAWWLRRFAYGPVEWLWRRMTYGRGIPLRIPPARSAVP